VLLERLPPGVLTTKARQLTVPTILERSLIKGRLFLGRFSKRAHEMSQNSRFPPKDSTCSLEHPHAPGFPETCEQVTRTGYALVRAPAMSEFMGPDAVVNWESFARSWEDLGTDGYMADGGRYRRRRFSAFTVGSGKIRLKPPQPHYQSRDFNPLNGGVERWFKPVTDVIAAHLVTKVILKTCDSLFTELTPSNLRPKSWHVEMHQFRVEARSGVEGKPTPEGMHQDGVDWVLVMLVRRENIASGATTIANLQAEPIGEFTLSQPMDSSFVDDNRVYHGVTPIRPLNPARPAYRDVLVLTFRRE